MSALPQARARLLKSFEEAYGPYRFEPEPEPPFRPDFRAALRVANLRAARLRIQIAKVDAKLARIAVQNLRTKVEALTTNDTPCDDCGGAIGKHRRFTGQGGVLCEECEREAFGH